MTPTDEIKQRIDIIDLIQEYIQLKPAGVNFKARCPFHNEKTPSFIASPEKQIWHCFGCGKGGDVFTFLQEIEGLEFAEALKILAQKAGIKLQYTEPGAQSYKNRLWKLNSEIAGFWQKNLWDNKGNQEVKDYLLQRKLSSETIKDFSLGYASADWHEATNYLKKQGYSDKEIFQAGVSAQSEKTKDFYDRFRNRIIFPIKDLQGNVVAFGGRVFEQREERGKSEAKYLNSPQTAIYNKSLVLYGLDKSKLEIKKKDYVILVEGYLDLISVYQAGTKNAVASSGTALTPEQVRILKRYTDNLMISFDADEAGRHAAQRGVEVALKEDMNIKIIELKDFKDPDECIKNDPNKWLTAIKQAKHFVDYYFDQVFNYYDLKRADHKKKAIDILLKFIAKLPNVIDQTHYLQKLAKDTDMPEEILRDLIKKKKATPSVNINDETETSAKKVKTDKKLIISQRVFALVIKNPNYLKVLIDNLEPDLIRSELLQGLYKLMVNYYNLNQSFDLEDFKKSLQESAYVNEVDKLTLLGENEFADWEEGSIQHELINNINYLKKDDLTARLNKITEAIKISEKDGDENRLNILSQEFNRISQELKNIK